MTRRFPIALIEAAPQVPAEGLVGDLAITEAYAGSYQDLMRRIEGAIKQARATAGVKDGWAYVRALYPDVAVVNVSGVGEDMLWSYPYTVDGDLSITLGVPTQVVETFRPVQARMAEGAGSVTALAEAAADTTESARFKVVVIRAGLSKNGNYYPDKVLKGATALLEGARVFVKADADHLRRGGKDPRALVGRITAPVFVAGKKSDTGLVEAVMELIDPADAMTVKLREAVKKGMGGLFGLSIDADGEAAMGKAGSRTIAMVESISAVHSVDLIVEPGAGGAVISLIEAAGSQTQTQEDDVPRKKLIAMLEARGLLAGRDVNALSDEQLVQLIEGVLPAAPAPVAAPAPAPGVVLTEAAVNDQVSRALALIEARATARDRVNRTRLPEPAKQRIIKQLTESATAPTEAEITAAIKAEAEYLGQVGLVEGARVAGLGDVAVIEDQWTKHEARLTAFFNQDDPNHRQARSFREAYLEITGDTGFTGRADRMVRLTEAADSTTFAKVLNGVMNKRMLASYRGQGLPDYRLIATVNTGINDFKPQYRVRYAGYGDLPEVAEKGPYLPMSTPAEEEATYRVSKRGGTESMTMEMIRNDDVGLIRDIPIKLGRAARRTLHKFVFHRLIIDNPVIYDGKALFHADHGNLHLLAFSDANYGTIRTLFLQQTEFGGEDVLGVAPATMLFPAQLDKAVYDVFFNRGTSNDASYAMTYRPQNLLSQAFWTDPNDWYLAAATTDIPGMEIGFLDGNEEPELFFQDVPTGGSMFANDTVTIKIRHIYGGAITDYRAFHASKPAN